MKAEEALEYLVSLGYTITAKGGKWIVKGPKGARYPIHEDAELTMSDDTLIQTAWIETAKATYSTVLDHWRVA